jgi:hypothetical protein
MRLTRESRKPALGLPQPGFSGKKSMGKPQVKEVDMPGVFLYYLDMHVEMEV